MKRLIAAFVLLVLLFSICTGALLITEKATNEIDEKAKELHELAALNDERLPEALEEMDKLWERYELLLSLYTHHEDVETIGAIVALLSEFYELENYEQLQIACRQIMASAEHMKETEQPRLKNIL